MNYDKIGKFIQEKRKAKKLTQKELALKVGVTDKAISKWERGQGCPDVSILEVLSRELDCSILELLKGREIENEVISITEADDYIKESMIFSKANFKSKIKFFLNRTIEVSIIFFVLFLSYLNIVQVMYLDKEYSYRVNYYKKKEIVSYIDTLEKKISVLKNNQGKFSDEDYQLVVTNIDNYYEDINKLEFLKYIKSREVVTYTINDLRIFNMNGYYLGYELEVLDILNTYVDDDKIDLYKELTSTELFKAGSLSLSINSKPYLTYKYSIGDSIDDELAMYGDEIDNLHYIENSIEYELCKLIYLTDLVMEVGDINE